MGGISSKATDDVLKNISRTSIPGRSPAGAPGGQSGGRGAAGAVNLLQAGASRATGPAPGGLPGAAGPAPAAARTLEADGPARPDDHTRPDDYAWTGREPAPRHETDGILGKPVHDWSATDALKVMTSRDYATPAAAGGGAAQRKVAQFFDRAYPGAHKPDDKPAPTLFDPDERRRVDAELAARRATERRPAAPAQPFRALRLAMAETPATGTEATDAPRPLPDRTQQKDEPDRTKTKDPGTTKPTQQHPTASKLPDYDAGKTTGDVWSEGGPIPGLPDGEYRIKDLGLEIVGDDHKGPLTGGQVTRKEYDQMAKEAAKEHTWDLLDGLKYWIDRDVRPIAPKDRDLKAFKDGWVRDHTTTIKVLARKHGIPREVLAGIAWSEVGGDPDIFDPLARWGRSGAPDWVKEKFPTLKISPEKTSAGDVSIQLRHVAEQYGITPSDFTPEQQRKALNLLQNESVNLDIVARHVSDLFKRAYPDAQTSSWTQEQIERVGDMYNAGYMSDANWRKMRRESAAGKHVTDYGKHLIKKWDRMKGLVK
ncbi:MAG: hypothetical protein H6907_09035 [Hyphomicrobiales bacterium]|nr:hypothetical protein [Hyphomicrobiales bacterium]MCP5371862.1 hypothetical protein [Hyphomicrobiales bacterium]